jgi:dCTP deaminase
MFEVPCGVEGVFPVQWLRKAVGEGIIESPWSKIPDANFQPASLDLRLGATAYRLRCSFLPGALTVEEKLAEFAMGDIDLRDGGILERNQPYLIPLVEEIHLPDGVHAKSNPRSSTGRLDIFTRVISDHSHQFDEVRSGYRGKLYLEVVSRSFTIKVKEKLSLNQLRLIKGDARSNDGEIVDLHQRTPVLFIHGTPASSSELELADGLFLSIDLTNNESGFVGYRAKKNSHLLDLSQVHHYKQEEFWEPVHTEPKNRLVLEPEEFYLLVSAENVRIPPHLAAEMVAYDPTSGELRSHYAGFFDPGFGYDDQGLLPGTCAVLEVRAHDVPFMIEHRQKICKLGFEKVIERPEVLYGSQIGSSYQHQALTLSKHFIPASPPSPTQTSFL